MTDQRPVVFVHGAGDAGGAWKRVGDLVRDAGIEWEAPDLFALVDGEAPSIEVYADAIAAYCDAAEWNDIVLVGHSMGSLIALEVAGRTPPWLGALVLIGVGSPMRVSTDLLDMAVTDPEQASALIAKWSHERGYFSSHPEIIREHQSAIAHVPPHVLASDLAACDSYENAVSVAQMVSVPTTVVTAGRDRMVPPDSAMPIVDSLPDSTTVDFDTVGHRVQWEAPNEVARAIVAAAQCGPTT